jgi:hypothetical protein
VSQLFSLEGNRWWCSTFAGATNDMSIGYK